MKIENVLVTGANRGIGLEFVRQFSQLEVAPQFIFATYRNAQSLEDLKKIQDSSTKSRVILIKMDVTDGEEIKAAKQIVEQTVGERGLKLLINNAGVAEKQEFPLLVPERLEWHFRTNTVGPIMILQTFLPLLEKAVSASETSEILESKAAVVNISSALGSIQRTGEIILQDLVVPGYKISKAALNMAMRLISAKVKDKGILVVNIHPGWVKTEMGGKDVANLEPEESIASMIETILKMNKTYQGSFVDRFGDTVPF